jgi:hypothetical protein
MKPYLELCGQKTFEKTLFNFFFLLYSLIFWVFGVVYHVLYVFRSHVVTLATTASKWLIRLASQQVYSLMLCVCFGFPLSLSFSQAIDSHVTKSLFPPFLAKKDAGPLYTKSPQKRGT